MTIKATAFFWAVFLCLTTQSALGDSPSHSTSRVLPAGKLPNDRRLEKPRSQKGYFPFHPPATLEDWETRARQLKRRILVSSGLWPMPRTTPLNAVIHGRVEREGFTIEKVYFESYPGHYVTGLLFRPKGREGKLPAVLSPHGHGGRLQDLGEKGVREQIVRGAERFEGSGRYPKLARCAQLARMGCVTFIYDMEGYADSVQIPPSVHRQRTDRREQGMDSPERWGFFSTQSDLRLQTFLGLQTYNSIRALDFLAGLPDVNRSRIAVTGGSGGGTQTLLLCAIDRRPRAAFPQGMVSTDMQGGCLCENAPYLRLGTGNVELTAIYAPKPQGMTAANDWTHEMMTKGYPELRHIYRLYGNEDGVLCKDLTQFGHNFNYVTRAVMYQWFNKHLRLGLDEPIIEADFPPLTEKERRVWNDAHPMPESSFDHEAALTKHIGRESRRQIDALTPTDAASLATYRGVIGGAFEVIFARPLDAVGPIDREKMGKEDRGDYVVSRDLLRVVDHGEELPTVSFYPRRPGWNGEVVIWMDGRGKAALFTDSGAPRNEVRRLLEAGTAVFGADLLLEGEFLADGGTASEAPMLGRRGPAQTHTLCYNDSLFARRVHDIVSLISYAKHSEYRPRKLHLVGTNGAGPWVAAARSQVASAVERAVVDTGGFRFASLESYRDVNFLAGSVKYGDLPALLALSAPQDLFIIGEDGKLPRVVEAAYRAADATSKLHSQPGRSSEALTKGLEWLVE